VYKCTTNNTFKISDRRQPLNKRPNGLILYSSQIVLSSGGYTVCVSCYFELLARYEAKGTSGLITINLEMYVADEGVSER